MNLDDIKKYLFSFVIGVLIGLGLVVTSILIDKHYRKESSPVEKNDTIDSLIKINNNIKINIEKLDSVKNAEIIEVSTLDNDSTVKLFYKLVTE